MKSLLFLFILGYASGPLYPYGFANPQPFQSAGAADQPTQDVARHRGRAIYYTLAPIFSVKAGKVQRGATIKISCPTRDAEIYYTTTGWAPTANSLRYKGPIPIDANTEIQAMAVAPHLTSSAITIANYTTPNSPDPPQPPALLTDGTLRAGTGLRLMTASTVSSRTAKVGDTVKIVLDQNVNAGPVATLLKGTEVKATITTVQRAGRGGKPGEVSFAVVSILRGKHPIPLRGGETRKGANHYDEVNRYLLAPIVGIARIAQHGEEAVIQPGMPLTAFVISDTRLQFGAE